MQRKIQESDAMAFDANRQFMARNLCAFYNAHETQCADYLYTIAGLRNFD